MTTQISSQIQVYHRLIRQHHGFMMEYAEVQTITHEYIEAADIFAQPENPLSLSFELTFVMSLILLLPIFIYLAYRYGKKMGKKENNLSSPQTSSPIIKKLTLSNRSTGDAFSESDEADFEPLVPFESRKNVAPGETNCNNKNTFKQENVSQTKNSLSPSKSTSSENSNNSGKSTEGTKEKGLNSNIKSGSQSQDDDILNKLNPPFKYATNDDLVTFSLTMQHAFDKETRNPNLHHSLDDEKILLHTDENQVKKREMKFQLNLEMKNGVFEKVETQEVRTVYCETAQEPEMNALLLKKAYEKYQDNSLNDKPFLNLNKNKENRGFRNALVPLKTPLIYQHVLTSENQLCLLDGSNKVSKNQNNCQESDTIPKSPEEAKIQDLQVLLEQDDLPHETGKFNKIFKNPEIIGEGSFGEVYKVNINNKDILLIENRLSINLMERFMQ